MDKKWPRLVLRLIFYSYLVPIVWMTLDVHMFAIRQAVAHKSYIKSAEPLEWDVLESLVFFNNKSTTDIVKFSGKRPITIRKMTLFEEVIFGPRVLGVAFPTFMDCKILLNMGNLREYDKDHFRTTVIHEYLHCLGYNHVDKYGDLMYYANTGPSLKNIYYWAGKVKREIFYER